MSSSTRETSLEADFHSETIDSQVPSRIRLISERNETAGEDRPKKRLRTSDPSPCQVCKKPTRNNDDDRRCCRKCTGALLGAWKFPVCRVCHWVLDYGERGCHCTSNTTNRRKTCEGCPRRRSMDDFFLDAPATTNTPIRTITGYECFHCRPQHLQEQWDLHRPVVFQLGRRGIQMYDCDPVIAQEPFRSQTPPVEEFVGHYDLLYTRWETIGNGATNSLEFGDVLQKRTLVQGSSLKLSLVGDDQESSINRLEGVIELPKASGEAMEDPIVDLPSNKKIAFRFADGATSTASVKSGCLSVRSQDETHAIAYLEDLGLNRETNWDPRAVEKTGLWKAYHGSSVSLQVLGSKASFDWVPRDDYTATSHYAETLRKQIRHHRNRDGSQSWLYRHTSLSEHICQRIHEYLTYLPPPALEVQEDDLWISLCFARSGGRSLQIKFLARRQKA